MADEKRTISDEQKAKMQAGREAAKLVARNGRAAKRAPLSKHQSFALRMAQNAKTACSMIAEQIRSGDMPEAKVLEACSVLSGAMASGLAPKS